MNGFLADFVPDSLPRRRHGQEISGFSSKPKSPKPQSPTDCAGGARQVGKSHTISQYGATSFEHLVEVNLELNPSYKNCFESLDPTRICRDSRLPGSDSCPSGI